MVQHHIVGKVQTQGIIACRGCLATWSDAEIADDNIRLFGTRHFASFYSYSLARSGLSRYGDVAADAYRGLQRYVTTYVQYHYSIAPAHGVTEGAGAGVVQIGHVIYFATSSSCGQGSESQGLRKSQRGGVRFTCHWQGHAQC